MFGYVAFGVLLAFAVGYLKSKSEKVQFAYNPVTGFPYKVVKNKKYA